ncbi:hypothetical protein KSC_100950 [Ktedonobacter sp. SOSP1-52]|uniref:UvrD-helicase domain-containing protein n=1 Tax=Ktedonobacter sp. SOSP1-52 TaxID=2778366 RepID=UPI001916A9DF|nr:UvrD-helicase domain-containing protein [Ktedonobacter sp. SOSP1-52]GHO71203.1 hypothetical protein KSC_100950 [Ktedonobacter sp. SOSP1-52]
MIVDEYQDRNPLQAAIYRALAADPPHQVCVVGDDDQSLFRFRGGTVGCMVRFAEECHAQWPGCEVKRVVLRETYRSHPAIVHWINEYITIHPQMALPNARVHEKARLLPQLPNEPTTPVIWAIQGKTKQDVATNFVDVLCALKEHDVIESYGQCALLGHSFKAKFVASLYVNELIEQGIPLTSSTSAKDHPVYQQILGTLLLALDRSQNLMPATYAVNNTSLARYVEACRQAAQTNPLLATMARQIATWLTTDPGAGRRMSLTALAQLILNAEPCIVSIQEDPVAELAAP